MSLINAREMLKNAKQDIAEEKLMYAINKELNEGIESLLDRFHMLKSEFFEIRDKYDRYAKNVIRKSLEIEFFLLNKTISRPTHEQQELLQTAHKICGEDHYMDFMDDLRRTYLGGKTWFV